MVAAKGYRDASRGPAPGDDVSNGDGGARRRRLRQQRIHRHVLACGELRRRIGRGCDCGRRVGRRCGARRTVPGRCRLSTRHPTTRRARPASRRTPPAPRTCRRTPTTAARAGMAAWAARAWAVPVNPSCSRRGRYPYWLAVDSTSIYWTDDHDQLVLKCPLSRLSDGRRRRERPDDDCLGHHGPAGHRRGRGGRLLD